MKGKYMVDSTSGRTAEDSMDMVVRHKGGVPILGQGDYIEMSNYTTLLLGRHLGMLFMLCYLYCNVITFVNICNNQYQNEF